MLVRAFFCFSFILSALWLAIAATYVDSRIGWGNLMSMNPSELAFFITAVCIPALVLWVIMGLFYFARVTQKQGDILKIMMHYMKDSSDRNRLMSRSLFETQGILRSYESLHYVDTYVAELNNVIAEIAIRFNILRRSSLVSLWHQVQTGDKWAFCNVILDSAADNPDFSFNLAKSAIKDRKLADAIELFCQRVETLFAVLRRSESFVTFAGVMETSNLGKLYRLISAVNAQQKRFDNGFTAKKDSQKVEESNLFSIAGEEFNEPDLFGNTDDIPILITDEDDYPKEN